MNKTTYEQPMDAKFPMEEAKMSRSDLRRRLGPKNYA